MSRKIVIPSGLLVLVLVATIASVARAVVYYMNPMEKDGQAWGGCIFAGLFVGVIVAKVIANAWPETKANSANTDRSGFWGGFSIEISSDGGGEGGGDGGGGDGGGGGGE
jgi:uncharacterized membrane protein YgcG